MAVYLKKKKVYKDRQLPLPIITQENAADMLNPQDQYNLLFTSHSSASDSYDLTMSVLDKRAITYLLEFLRNKPQWFEDYAMTFENKQ